MLDIGCGANLIYPLLGAATHGWRFVAADNADVAVKWAARNLRANPSLQPLIQVRHVAPEHAPGSNPGARNRCMKGLRSFRRTGGWAQTWSGGKTHPVPEGCVCVSAARIPLGVAGATMSQYRVKLKHSHIRWLIGGTSGLSLWPPRRGIRRCAAGILLPAMREGEAFTFTMCNPPFFESMEEAGRNPATASSGTAREMTCPGGELAFVMQMIRDSAALQVAVLEPLHITRIPLDWTAAAEARRMRIMDLQKRAWRSVRGPVCAGAKL